MVGKISAGQEHRMKKILLGSAFAVLSAHAALATDLPAKAPARMYNPAPVYSWSGVYGGVSGGYAWGKNELLNNIGGINESVSPSGGFGGVQLGYNYQFSPNWLIGGELDASFGDIRDTASTIPAGRSKFDSFGTARTRFGYVQNNWLLYGTGGAIWLHDRSDIVVPGAVISSVKGYHVDWVFGGGIEYAIDPRWSWKIEYLYAPFDRNFDFGEGPNESRKATLNIVRAGLNYRFGGATEAANSMPVKAIAPQSSWQGSYIGLHGGYGWADYDRNLPGTTYSLKPDGWFGGMQAGYNWVYAPNMLFGFEIDSAWGDLKKNGIGSNAAPATAKIDDLGTARFRLGYVAGDMLYYGTAGAAYAQEKFSSAAGSSTRLDHLGWVAGGGVEYKFAPQWSAKLEYNYADLGEAKYFYGVAKSSDLTLQTVKVGINYYGSVVERFFGGR
jgi:outer membrane immunogenic protein